MHRTNLALVSTMALVIACTALATNSALARQEAQAPATKPSPAVVNLNTATAAQLEGLPGIGPKTAERIVEYRQKNGGFKKIEELMNVRGVGEKSFLKLKPLISVAPSKSERGSAPFAL